ncbi:MAG TPA: hypothetical protein VJ953_15105 [Saprospiraceae bacterium]|nr:hypothetical protein [Saprospiraceae bacterium]
MAKPAFYHWQTELALDTVEQEWLNRLAVERVYVKFFDVDWDEGRRQLEPQAQLRVDTQQLAGLREIVPCVFITNRSFLEASEEQLAALPEQVFQKLQQLQEQLPQDLRVQELQLDCDWSARTRAAFFDFLAALRPQAAAAGWQLSATIRLHQLADPKGTGVPPVDRGMLMFYNMGTLASWQEHNSILNLEAALPYLSGQQTRYPLPLDVALPVFNWGVLFRDGSFTRLLNNLDTTLLADGTRFEKLTAYRFRVRKNGYLQGSYVYEDDLIRVETIQPAQLKASRALLAPYLRTANYISFYHLDASLLKQLLYADLEAFFDD